MAKDTVFMMDDNVASEQRLAKLMRAWETKNGKRAKKGMAFSLIAVSLSACGGGSDITPEEAQDIREYDAAKVVFDAALAKFSSAIVTSASALSSTLSAKADVITVEDAEAYLADAEASVAAAQEAVVTAQAQVDAAVELVATAAETDATADDLVAAQAKLQADAGLVNAQANLASSLSELQIATQEIVDINTYLVAVETLRAAAASTVSAIDVAGSAQAAADVAETAVEDLATAQAYLTAAEEAEAIARAAVEKAELAVEAAAELTTAAKATLSDLDDSAALAASQEASEALLDATTALTAASAEVASARQELADVTAAINASTAFAAAIVSADQALVAAANAQKAADDAEAGVIDGTVTAEAYVAAADAAKALADAAAVKAQIAVEAANALTNAAKDTTTTIDDAIAADAATLANAALSLATTAVVVAEAEVAAARQEVDDVKAVVDATTVYRDASAAADAAASDTKTAQDASDAAELLVKDLATANAFEDAAEDAKTLADGAVAKATAALQAAISLQAAAAATLSSADDVEADNEYAAAFDALTAATTMQATAQADVELAREDVAKFTLDFDGDGIANNIDAFDEDPLEWYDADSDGIGNNADNEQDFTLTIGRDVIKQVDGPGIYGDVDGSDNTVYAAEETLQNSDEIDLAGGIDELRIDVNGNALVGTLPNTSGTAMFLDVVDLELNSVLNTEILTLSVSNNIGSVLVPQANGATPNNYVQSAVAVYVDADGMRDIETLVVDDSDSVYINAFDVQNVVDVEFYDVDDIRTDDPYRDGWTYLNLQYVEDVEGTDTAIETQNITMTDSYAKLRVAVGDDLTVDEPGVDSDVYGTNAAVSTVNISSLTDLNESVRNFNWLVYDDGDAATTLTVDGTLAIQIDPSNDEGEASQPGDQSWTDLTLIDFGGLVVAENGYGINPLGDRTFDQPLRDAGSDGATVGQDVNGEGIKSIDPTTQLANGGDGAFMYDQDTAGNVDGEHRYSKENFFNLADNGNTYTLIATNGKDFIKIGGTADDLSGPDGKLGGQNAADDLPLTAATNPARITETTGGQRDIDLGAGDDVLWLDNDTADIGTAIFGNEDEEVGVITASVDVVDGGDGMDAIIMDADHLYRAQMADVKNFEYLVIEDDYQGQDADSAYVNNGTLSFSVQSPLWPSTDPATPGYGTFSVNAANFETILNKGVATSGTVKIDADEFGSELRLISLETDWNNDATETAKDLEITNFADGTLNLWGDNFIGDLAVRDEEGNQSFTLNFFEDAWYIGTFANGSFAGGVVSLASETVSINSNIDTFVPVTDNTSANDVNEANEGVVNSTRAVVIEDLILDNATVLNIGGATDIIVGADPVAIAPNSEADTGAIQNQVDGAIWATKLDTINITNTGMVVLDLWGVHDGILGNEDGVTVNVNQGGTGLSLLMAGADAHDFVLTEDKDTTVLHFNWTQLSDGQETDEVVGFEGGADSIANVLGKLGAITAVGGAELALGGMLGATVALFGADNSTLMGRDLISLDSDIIEFEPEGVPYVINFERVESTGQAQGLMDGTDAVRNVGNELANVLDVFFVADENDTDSGMLYADTNGNRVLDDNDFQVEITGMSGQNEFTAYNLMGVNFSDILTNDLSAGVQANT